MTDSPQTSPATRPRPTDLEDPAPGGASEASATAEPRGYRPSRPIRIVTAASLFDGHDAAINVMRRILQSSGAEVIHLGHNRSVAEVVDCAIQEDAQGIAISSYQGGHVEYFEYMVDLLRERGARIAVFGGGGGTILPEEIERLHAHGVARIYSPDDGRALGLQGMIDHLLATCDFPTVDEGTVLAEEQGLRAGRASSLARLITVAENLPAAAGDLAQLLQRTAPSRKVPVLGITGTGGAGKSSLVDELVRRLLADAPQRRVAVLSVDPSKRRSGGALLGDRIRMNAIDHPQVYMRSLATRQANLSLSRHVGTAIELAQAAGFELVIVETSGIGQSDTEIVEHADLSLYVMTAEYGAATQLEKIDMLDFADLIAINKFDKRGSEDALRDVRKQVQRNRQWFDRAPESLPVFGTVASQFNDGGMNRLYAAVLAALGERTGVELRPGASAGAAEPAERPATPAVIPADRTRYLAEIAEASQARAKFVTRQVELARSAGQVRGTLELLRAPEREAERATLTALAELLEGEQDPECRRLLEGWPALVERYRADQYSYRVRDRQIEEPLVSTSLSGTRVRKVILPRYHDRGDVLRWLLEENVPGEFPYTAGVFPLKRSGEDPARMFAGEGGPERTNRRFHYLSHGMPAARLSTAFDSVTLYGEDPDRRPDIYGKVGNSGVSIATVDDAKRLYSGFDLCAPNTSVSMTINGPAPMLLAFFLNAAIDQACEKHLLETGRMGAVERELEERFRREGHPRPRYRGELPPGHSGLGTRLLGVSGDQVLDAETYGRIRAATLATVRGTVQADILKEDQAQNTCIFSTEFALRMMGDIQQLFIDQGVRNFYSVSISGYHIAEAGANPITQLAFTLANGFTYVEYYRARGMAVDDFAPNLSFFFSNGVDPEYAVIGRVARRIWAKALRLVYGGSERSQKLKYHIQTSGRSLHAQEIAFNDIRTTLQALYALYDNCNSLHTNAYDEAITTPTEESVRRALAIQLIINKELGLSKNENPLQGSFVIEELTDLVEEAVYAEFRRLSDRGGVLGAMERMYQRGRIQDESLRYETAKHDGSLPIIGVNTFLDRQGSPTARPAEVIRSDTAEKEAAILARDQFFARHAERAPAALAGLKRAALAGENLFRELLEVGKVASLGQISAALYQVGGQYRRNM
jgi:methylmalonyl-CoA mutase